MALMADELRAFIEALDDGAILIDSERRIVWYNAALSKKLAALSSSTAGRFCCEVLPCLPTSETIKQHECPALRALTGRCLVKADCLREPGSDAARYEGLAIPVTISGAQLGAVVEIWRDVSEISRLKAGFQQRLRYLSDLHLAGLVSNRTLSLNQILSSTLDLILNTLCADAGGIYLLEDQNGETILQLKAYRSIAWEVVQDIDYLKVGEGFSGRVVQLGRPLIVEDVRHDPRLSRHLLNRDNPRAALVVPLQSDGRVIGTVWAASKQPDVRFTEQEQDWLVAVGAQLALAIENARLYEELQQREMERSRLLAHVINAQEEERKRVARELHDDINQALTLLTLDVDRLSDTLADNPQEMRAALRRLKMDVGHIINDVQRIILDLRPGPLDDLGLVPALKWYASSRLEAAGIKLHLEVTGPQECLSDDQEIALFRVVQEALNNIVQHAQAENVHLTIHFLSSKVVVRIEDDGIGFNVNESFGRVGERRGLGLLGMKERLSLIGGQLEVRSALHKGTQLRLYIPLNVVEVQKGAP